MVGHPVLEALWMSIGNNASLDIAGDTANRLNEAKIEQGIEGFEWIIEIFASIDDTGKARTNEQIIAQNLGPQIFDLSALGKEAMAADIKAVAIVFDGA